MFKNNYGKKYRKSTYETSKLLVQNSKYIETPFHKTTLLMVQVSIGLLRLGAVTSRASASVYHRDRSSRNAVWTIL